MDSKKMLWCYDLALLHKYKIRHKIMLPIDSHCHALLVGGSGSGKSVASLYLMGHMLRAIPSLTVFVCDFKGAEDFRFLEGYKHYYRGEDCYKGVLEYQRAFSDIREGGCAQNRHLLIFDEYPAAVLHWQARDKREKTRRAADVLSAVAEILMLGRSLKFGIWCICQRASSELFAQGARDNYMVILALGKLSKEQRGMLFSGEVIPERVYQPGEGVMLADGYGLQEIKIPFFDTGEWKKRIRGMLDCPSGA